LERVQRAIGPFVGGRVKPGHDGKRLNLNSNVMRVLDTRIHDSSGDTAIRIHEAKAERQRRLVPRRIISMHCPPPDFL
jgi:hypothetical protein